MRSILALLGALMMVTSAAAFPAPSSDNNVLWANVDSDFNFWLEADQGEPAYGGVGSYCGTDAEGEFVPTPCAPVAGDVGWQLPVMGLTEPLVLSGEVVMTAYVAAGTCAPEAGCVAPAVGNVTFTAQMIQDGETLVEGAAQEVVFDATTSVDPDDPGYPTIETVAISWHVPVDDTWDPALAIVWNITASPAASSANIFYLLLREDTWSNVALPIVALPEPEPEAGIEGPGPQAPPEGPGAPAAEEPAAEGEVEAGAEAPAGGAGNDVPPTRDNRQQSPGPALPLLALALAGVVLVRRQR